MQSFKYRRETIADRKEREGTESAKTFWFGASESMGNLFIVTGEVSAYLRVIPGMQTYIDYHRVQEKFLQRAFVKEQFEIPPLSVFVGHRYAQH